MSKIYIPDYKQSTYPCVVVQNATTVRAYKQMPYNPSSGNVSIPYRDFYFTGNYLFTDNNQNFSNSTTLPTCQPVANLTDSVYYRNDFDSILIMFLIMCIFCFLIPLKVFQRFSRRLR